MSSSGWTSGSRHHGNQIEIAHHPAHEALPLRPHQRLARPLAQSLRPAELLWEDADLDFLQNPGRPAQFAGVDRHVDLRGDDRVVRGRGAALAHGGLHLATVAVGQRAWQGAEHAGQGPHTSRIERAIRDGAHGPAVRAHGVQLLGVDRLIGAVEREQIHVVRLAQVRDQVVDADLRPVRGRVRIPAGQKEDAHRGPIQPGLVQARRVCRAPIYRGPATVEDGADDLLAGGAVAVRIGHLHADWRCPSAR